MKTSEILARQLEVALAREAEQEAVFGTEPTKDGAVVAWRLRFPNRNVWYRYAAIRANGLWYTTGPHSPKGYTWQELTDWISENRVRKFTRLR